MTPHCSSPSMRIFILLFCCTVSAQETNFFSLTAAIARVPDFNWIGAGTTNIGGTNYFRHHPQPVTNHFIIFVDRNLNNFPFRIESGTVNSNEVRLTQFPP